MVDSGEVGRRLRSERGAALVESAIVVPFVLLLLFGIIEYGLVFMDASGYSSSTRSGARAAVAASRNPTYQDMTRRAVESTMANVSGGSPRTLVVYRADPVTGNPRTWNGRDYTSCSQCWVYRWDGSKPTGEKWVDQRTSTWPATSQYACGDAATDVLGVWVEGRHDFITGLFGSGMDLRERTVMRLEPQPSSGGAACKP